MASYKQYETKKGKLWEVNGYIGTDPLTGEVKKYRKRGFDTKKEAQHYFNSAKLQFENGISDKKPISRTYKDVYEEWLPLYAMNVEKSTLNKTETYFRIQILPALGHYYINKITSRKLQLVLNDWHKQYVSYKKIYNYACMVFQYALSYGYIDENPKIRVISPRGAIVQPKKVTADFYDKKELEQFLEYAKLYSNNAGHSMWHTFYRVLAFTGLRKSEALALTWQDINFKDKTLTVNKAIKQDKNNTLYLGKPKTKSSNRTIVLDDNTVNYLRIWKVEQARLLLGFGYSVANSEQLLFCKMNNTFLDLSTPRNRMVRICKRYNFKMINIHGFRHGHCSLLFEAGVSIKDVMERLGHSDMKTTITVYSHVTETSRSNSAELFSKYANF